MGRRRKKAAKKKAVPSVSNGRQGRDDRLLENGPGFEYAQEQAEFVISEVPETGASDDGAEWPGTSGILENYPVLQYAGRCRCCSCQDRVYGDWLPGQALQRDTYTAKDEMADTIDTSDKKEDVEEICRQDYLIIKKSSMRHILKAALYIFSVAAAAYIFFWIGYREGVSSVSAWL